MKYRTFPKLPELKLSQFGMGLMRLPVIDDDYGKIDDEKAVEMLEAAIAEGVNYFDTAHPYHEGDSQRFTAQYIVPRLEKEDLHIATKLPQWMANSYNDYDKILNEQLEILGIDQIEFYLIHALGDDSWEKHKNLGIIDFIKKAVADGRIKYPCFSYHGNLDTFKEIVDSYDGWIMTQIMLNYVDENWQAGLEGMKYAYAKDIGIVIMEPLKGGMLVNKLPEKIEKLFKEKNLSPVDAAMNWCYDFKEPTVVLSGVSTLEQTNGQIEIANKAEALKLSADEKEVIAVAKENFNLVPCSECKYCQPCPFDVKIPNILSMYNDYVIFGRENAKKDYQKLVADGHGADLCTECGACEEVCPQSIEIIKYMKLAHEKMG